MSDEDEEPDHTFTLVRERYHRLLRQFDFDAVGRRYDYCNVNYAVLVGVLHLLRNLRCIYFFFLQFVFLIIWQLSPVSINDNILPPFFS